MRDILKEPLLHFLFIGALLFFVFNLANETNSGPSDDKIVVSGGRIEQLSNIFVKTWQRRPTREELQGLIDDFVLEEIYYRQAVAMGIDRDDTIIRRRLRQKVEFLTGDMATAIDPTVEELSAYLFANRDAFRQESTYTFQQVYINPEGRGDDLKDSVSQRLASLRAGQAPEGGNGLVSAAFESASRQEVDGFFGSGFAEMLDELAPGQWEGPFESGLGLHLIRLQSRTEGSVPDLAEIRPTVEREWANVRRLEYRRQINEMLLEEYEVVIEWPADLAEVASETR